ncbi:STY0301 family protein [Lysobacter antibioticus]|uniref:STY0301 family protein n=1 Tax=Lysobacter antibioticus TaxID=84531 RepID=UPI003CCCA97E
MSIYAAVLASAIQIVGCPEAIQDEQIVTPPPTEWSVLVPVSRHSLSEVDVFNGPPEEMRLLIGSTKKPGQIEWGKGKEVWVDCKYSHSAAVLRRKIGAVSGCAFVRPAQPSAAPPTFVCTK